MRTALFWLVSFSCILGGRILEGGHLGSLVQNAAAFIVLAPVFCFLIYAYGFKGLGLFFGRLLSRTIDERDGQVIDRASALGFMLGAIGGILGLIHVMENLSDTSRLGAGIAVAFVSFFYGALPAFFLMPVSLKSVSDAKKTIPSASYSAVACLMLLLCLFTVMYATSGHP